MTRTAAALFFMFVALSSGAAQPREGDFIARNFKFASGETLAELRIHYMTLGTPRRDASGVVRNAVLMLHGTTGSGTGLVRPMSSLFAPGELLDTTTHYIVFPDGIGHGKSSKPSDGLRMRFPRYSYDDMASAPMVQHRQAPTRAQADSSILAYIATMRRHLPGNHPTLREAFVKQAIAMRDRGEYQRAESLLRAVITTRDGTSLPSEDIALAMTYLGKLLGRRGAHQEAHSMLSKALSAQRAQFGEAHAVPANTLDAIGDVALASGDTAGAERSFRAALVVRSSFFAADHPDIAASLWNLGLVAEERGERIAAQKLYDQSLKIMRVAFGDSSSNVRELRDRLARLRTTK